LAEPIVAFARHQDVAPGAGRQNLLAASRQFLVSAYAKGEVIGTNGGGGSGCMKARMESYVG
jgi:hypothetical protein